MEAAAPSLQFRQQSSEPRTVTEPDAPELLERWHDYMAVSLSSNTARQYRRAIAPFLKHYRDKALIGIGEEDVTRWLALYEPRSPARAHYYFALRHFFGWAQRRGHVLINPLSDIPPPKPIERAPTSLSTEEVTRLVYAAAVREERRAWAILLLYYTGCRVNEVANFRWSDVGDGNLRVAEAKGGKQRLVPVSGALGEVLRGLRQIFPPASGEDRILPRQPATIWLYVRDAGRDANLGRRAHPHLLRSTFATRLLSRGAKVHTVQDLLGHASIKTTARYLAISDDDRRAAVELL